MKRKIFTSVLFVLCLSEILIAQVEQGRWLVGGSSNLGLSVGKTKVKTGSTTSDASKVAQFNFSPMVGYTVMDNLPVGLSLDFELYNYKSSNDIKDNITTFSIGPFARYYFGNLNGLMPYAEARIGFGSENDKYTNFMGTTTTDKVGLFNYRLGVGGTHFIGNTVGIDLFIGYNHNQRSFKSTGDGNDDTIYKYGSVVFNVGVIVMLGEGMAKE